MSEWDELSTSSLPAPSRDLPLGYCWYCKRRIDVTWEAWRHLPHDLMAHVDCVTLWMDGAALMAVGHRADYEDLSDYFEALEDDVRVLHLRGHFVTEPRLQARLDAQIEARFQQAVRELLAPENPWRRPGEDDQAYVQRVLDEDEDEDE
jgi:hypothetical protein